MFTDDELSSIRERLENLTRSKIQPKKIKSIVVNPLEHSLPKMTITVGEICKTLEPGAEPEMVLAIFDAVSFLVCTEKRGIESGLPYFFNRGDILKVIEFED
jgi:hypothetical protein